MSNICQAIYIKYIYYIYIYIIYMCGEPLQYSCLENLRDRGAWKVHGVTQRVGHGYDWTIYMCVCVFFKINIYLFIHFWLSLVLVPVSEVSVVAASRGYCLVAAGRPHSGDSFCCGAWALGHVISVVVVHGLSCSLACGIFPDQGANPCALHWQADS